MQNWCESRKHQPLFTFSFVLLRTLPSGNRVTDRLDTIANLPPVAYTAFTAGWIKMALGMDVGLGPGHIVLHGDPAPSPKRRQSPQFSAHFYCGQTAVYIRIPLSTGDPAPPEKKGTVPTHFLAQIYCGQTAGWIKMPLATEVNLGPGDVVLDGVPAPPP